jgi:F-box/leucine-rich repeat protein 2/20
MPLNRTTLVPLQFFHIGITQLSLRGARVDNIFFKRLSVEGPNLRLLDLSGCFRISDEGLSHVLKACSELTEISLENCRKLTDASLVALADHTKKLKAFNVGGNFNMTLDGIHILLDTHENHAKFAEVHISGHAATDATLNLITDRCKKLRGLSVGYSNVTDAGMMAMLKRRHHVRELRLHWCDQVTDALMAFLASSQCGELRKLNCCGLRTRVTDGALRSLIVTKCKASGGMANGSDSEQPPAGLTHFNAKHSSLDKTSVAFIRESYPRLEMIA